MKKIICNILLVFFACTFFFSLYKIIELKSEYDSGTDSYASLDAFVSIPEPTRPPATEPVATVPQASEGADSPSLPPIPVRPEKPRIQWPVIDFEALAAINPDVVAWIYIPGTNINYPVVQGRDNDHYLYYMFDGGYNRAGCLFLDTNVAKDFSASNSVIHGHNLMNGAMFAGLVEYQNQEFYESHPTALLMTPDGNYEIAFFSSYHTDVSSSAWDSMFTQEDYILWQSEISEKSCFETDLYPMSDDRIVTLSTCSYEFSNARFVVHGILIPEE